MSRSRQQPPSLGADSPKSDKSEDGVPLVRLPLELVAKEKEREVRKRAKSKRRMNAKDKEDIIRAACAGSKPIASTSAFGQGLRAAEVMASIFADKYARYTRKRKFDWRARLQSNKQALSCFSRAAAQADLIQAVYDTYIEAQFYWFDDYFKRAPRYTECASPIAPLRYNAYMALKQQGQTPNHVVHPARRVVDTRQRNTEEFMEFELKVLHRMIRQWGSEREVWELCGEPGDDEVFTEEFKQTREVWRTLFGKD